MADEAHIPSTKELQKTITPGPNDGLVGRLLGGKQTAPTNATFILCILLMVLFVIVLLAPLDPEATKNRFGLLTSVTGLLGAAIGYMFGNRSR